eukprot:NODE_50_length_27150_cov_0.307308.p13 type:complete len:165 gc:universal NODE_50_length_27150_cov_0.307308:8858-8364(-)
MINSIRGLMTQAEPKIPSGLLRLALHEKTGEHVLFLIICEKYFYNGRDSKEKLLDDIKDTFIKPDAPLEINISSKTRKMFLTCHRKDTSLRQCYEEVYAMLLDKHLERDQADIKPLHSYIIDLENGIANRNPDLTLKELQKSSSMDEIDKHEMALLGLLYLVNE